MTKAQRQQVYAKYVGHCAYCGKEITYEDMQVDHITPKRIYWDGDKDADKDAMDHIDNLNPSCRRCNHYKRGHTFEYFRKLMSTLHKRVRDIYICKVAEDYGIITVEPWDGTFYFERIEKS